MKTALAGLQGRVTTASDTLTTRGIVSGPWSISGKSQRVFDTIFRRALNEAQ